jgi:hypothetical protein
MNARREGLVAEVLELPREDRIDLLLEVKRRHAEVLAGTAKLSDWEDVRSRLLGR